MYNYSPTNMDGLRSLKGTGNSSLRPLSHDTDWLRVAPDDPLSKRTLLTTPPRDPKRNRIRSCTAPRLFPEDLRETIKTFEKYYKVEHNQQCSIMYIVQYMGYSTSRHYIYSAV